MMRKYSDKKNAQTQNYYKDRFYHAPHTVKSDVNESVFKDLGWFGFLEVFVFIVLLGVGFLYAYKKGAFAWQSIK